MTRPFAARDALRVRRLQPSGAWLELESAVLAGRSPLREAMGALWPLSDHGVDTLVLDPSEGVVGGFLQVRRRRRAPEADLAFIAPALESGQGVALCWRRLLADACQWLGNDGIQRVFVAVDEGNRVALQLLRQLGFTAFTHDTVLRRPADSAPPEAPTLTLVPESDVHRTAIERIQHQSLPRTARLAAGAGTGDWRVYPLGGHGRVETEGWVWLGADGQPCGAWRLVSGQDGHWLRAVVAHDAQAVSLLRAALARLADARAGDGRPIYAAARGYEPRLNLALREHDFEPLVGRFRMVKHTTARVVEPVWRTASVSDRGLDPAPSRSSARPLGMTVRPDNDARRT